MIGHIIMFIRDFSFRVEPIGRIDGTRRAPKRRKCHRTNGIGIFSLFYVFDFYCLTLVLARASLSARARLQFYDKTAENLGYDRAPPAHVLIAANEQSPR